MPRSRAKVDAKCKWRLRRGKANTDGQKARASGPAPPIITTRPFRLCAHRDRAGTPSSSPSSIALRFFSAHSIPSTPPRPRSAQLLPRTIQTRTAVPRLDHGSWIMGQNGDARSHPTAPLRVASRESRLWDSQLLLGEPRWLCPPPRLPAPHKSRTWKTVCTPDR